MSCVITPAKVRLFREIIAKSENNTKQKSLFFYDYPSIGYMRIIMKQIHMSFYKIKYVE